MARDSTNTDTHQKALAINLDPDRYGAFAEIGAGQEVSRWFFRVGGAAGTIAKTVSAYDMKVSDVTYGPADRYVSRERLVAMLQHEHTHCLDTLAADRGSTTSFFTFADTVAAASYRGTRECHAWMGVRFQTSPGAEDSQIVLHVRMLDANNVQQQEALGIVGVNLISGAFEYSDSPELLLKSLLDALSSDRIEVDMIEFTGAAFGAVDNRVMSLLLVQHGLTPTALFDTSGAVLQPSEVLYKTPVLVQPGRFRPPTLVSAEIQSNALSRFREEADVGDAPVVSMLGMTLEGLSVDGKIDVHDFLDRIDVLAAGEFTVLISKYVEYFRIAEYVSRYTSEPIGIALGVKNLASIFEAHHYDDLEGGVLEALGRLLKRQVKLFVYPTLEPESGELITAHDFDPTSGPGMIRRYLLDTGRIAAIETFDHKHLSIRSKDVLDKLRAGDPSWEEMVPPRIADAIKKKKLFGYHSS